MEPMIARFIFWLASWASIMTLGFLAIFEKEINFLEVIKYTFKRRFIIREGLWFAYKNANDAESMKHLYRVYLDLFFWN